MHTSATTVPHPTPGTAGYRPDIDGLRAVAVGAVLLFHAFPSVVSGGYIGVDIFFVISGYLITAILLREALNGRLSILGFYVRRARRIFPALLLVLLAVALAGWLVMYPSEWRQTGKHLLAGATFVSNLVLWREAGYFDTASDLKPLLHLWSLAVEEQYYLVWPLAIGLAAGRGVARVWWVCVVLAGASLAFCIAYTPGHRSAAFYLPMTRFWELLVGSGLAVAQARHWTLQRLDGGPGGPRTQAAAWLGLLMIGVAIATFDRNTSFPGHAALLPELGAAALVAAGPSAWVNRRLLAHPAMVGVGLISYPLYLWHWPLLSLSHLWAGAEPAPLVRAALLVAAVALAWLTYRWVERPLRSPTRHQWAKVDAVWLWLLLLAMGLAGGAAWRGWVPPQSARNPAVARVDQAQADADYARPLPMAGALPGRVLFVGDSHIEHYLPRLAQWTGQHRDRAYTVDVLSLNGCAPIPGLARLKLPCEAFTTQAYQAMLAPDVHTVVLASSWVGARQRDDYVLSADAARRPIDPLGDAWPQVRALWVAQLQGLTARGKRVVILLSSPRGPLVHPQGIVPRALWGWSVVRQEPRPRAELKAVVDGTDQHVREAARLAGAEVVDPFDHLCNGQTCPVVDEQGLPLYIDDSHLRASYVQHRVHYLDALMGPR